MSFLSLLLYLPLVLPSSSRPIAIAFCILISAAVPTNPLPPSVTQRITSFCYHPNKLAYWTFTASLEPESCPLGAPIYNADSCERLEAAKPPLVPCTMKIQQKGHGPLVRAYSRIRRCDVRADNKNFNFDMPMWGCWSHWRGLRPFAILERDLT